MRRPMFSNHGSIKWIWLEASATLSQSLAVLAEMQRRFTNLARSCDHDGWKLAS